MLRLSGLRAAAAARVPVLAPYEHLLPVSGAGAGEELFDVLDASGAPTGRVKVRSAVHRDGDFHAAAHVWLLDPAGRTLLARRSAGKDSHPGAWDMAADGHVSAGESRLVAAAREAFEEIGLALPLDAFELVASGLERTVTNGGAFVNNEHFDVFVVQLGEPWEGWVLQPGEVDAAAWVDVLEAGEAARGGARASPFAPFMPIDAGPGGAYEGFWERMRARFGPPVLAKASGSSDAAADDVAELSARCGAYARVPLGADTGALPASERAALGHLVAAARAMTDAFRAQLWAGTAPLLGELDAAATAADGGDARAGLIARYAGINGGPWDALHGGASFVRGPGPTVAVPQPRGGHVRVVLPVPPVQPPRGAFYPPHASDAHVRGWLDALPAGPERAAAAGYFTRLVRDAAGRLVAVPYSEVHAAPLRAAAAALRAAAGASRDPGLSAFCAARATAFETNDYAASDVAWLALGARPAGAGPLIDVTIGPYETYADGLMGLKATFEAYICVSDPAGTRALEAVSGAIPGLAAALPGMPAVAPPSTGGGGGGGGSGAGAIRVVNLVFSGGDTRGPATVAFNLPNDEAVVEAHGTAQVIMKNVMEAKFSRVLAPIAAAVCGPADAARVTFDAFFAHTLCHEVAHGVGPRALRAADGTASTVRAALGTSHSALEEAKADVLGLWAMRELVERGVLPAALRGAMYATFLAGCVRSVRFGTHEAHGAAQALALNWLCERGVFGRGGDGLLCVVADDDTAHAAVAELASIILRTQASGDASGAAALLARYGSRVDVDLTAVAHVPVDIEPVFDAEL